MPGARRTLQTSLELILTCEHGGNRVPRRYRAAFAGWERRLASHRGYDVGALQYARDFARAFRAPLLYSTTSRLLVELNRSLGHPQLFSARTRRLAPNERQHLVERYYLPYRRAVEARIRSALQRGRRVVHLSCHSFTPRLGAVLRKADIGVLFDPGRAGEAALCGAWRRALLACEPRLRVRRNYPYRGSADGLTTSLRRRFPEGRYLGIELEVSQKFPRGDARRWRRVRGLLVASFGKALASL
jgi:predicted N-formylglutamate amidohydrolase